ncbi:MAG: glutathione S-transferase family protein [Betaproteobacteria bacterium]|nr:glutathione S-transferase family protein [Betaproteobacteria bacterium]
MLELYHNDMSVCAAKVRLALAEKGLAYTGHHINLRSGDQKKPEYIALNPKGVVPTLIHDGFVVCESVVINEYINDAFPDIPLMPDTAQGRARVRHWTKQIDHSIFAATGTISVSIAFHHQYTPELIEEQVKFRGPSYRQMMEMWRKGPDNPAFPAAIKRMDKMLADMDKALVDGPWLLGKMFTLADAAYAPYLTRLDHLKFLGMLDGRPRTAAWYERMRSRKAYEDALAAWFNPKYLPLMEEKGHEAWPKVKKLLAEV